MSKRRIRRMVRFWLDVADPEQEWLYRVVLELKRRRELALTVRKGIALMVTLRQGDMSVLDELFPFVRESMKPKASNEFDDLIQKIKQLQDGKG